MLQNEYAPGIATRMLIYGIAWLDWNWMIQNSFDSIIPLRTLITRIVIDNSFRGSVTEHSLRERPCRVASNLGGGSSQATTAWCGSQGHKGVGNPVFPFSFNVKLKSRLCSWVTQCIVWVPCDLICSTSCRFSVWTPPNQHTLHLSSIEAPLCSGGVGPTRANSPERPDGGWAYSLHGSDSGRGARAVRNMANCYG